MEIPESPYVFLSYASPDRVRVLQVHDFLDANGIRVWLDDKRLEGGDNWRYQIRRALNGATLAIVFISRNSVDHTGYFQQEFRAVLDRAKDHPVHRTFLVPVLLDDTPIPDEVEDRHCVRLTEAGGLDGLLELSRKKLGLVEEVREATRREGEIEWKFESLEEKWGGLPGYEGEIKWPVYHSSRYPLISHASDAIRAEMQLLLAGLRSVQLEQMPDAYSYGQDAWWRTNSLNVAFTDPLITGRVLSQHATSTWYWAGSNHEQEGCHSWVFVMDPLVRIEPLPSIFMDSEAALALLKAECRHQLLAGLELIEPCASDEEWNRRRVAIEVGTAHWGAFGCFGFDEIGLVLRFPPYTVAPYAFGTLSAAIPYAGIRPLLRRPFVDALGLRWMD